jgi:hypothetical protein
MNSRQARHLILFFLLLAAILFSCCQSQKDRDRAQALQKQNDSLRTLIDSLRREFALRVHNSVASISDTRTGLWRLDTLSKTGRLVFTTEYPNASAYEIAVALNAAFRTDSAAQFKITAIRDNTAFVKILDSGRLTQGLGSAGAQEYLAQVTFSLTSVPGIHSVEFDFEEGDHAAPGIFDRQHFVDMLK